MIVLIFQGIGRNTGVWSSGIVGLRVAHERHLMGLLDQYMDHSDSYSVPNLTLSIILWKSLGEPSFLKISK